MLKKIDRYILRLFAGPFLVIFSVLFFIFIIQFLWSKLNDFTGKGLEIFTIVKLIFYFGLSLVPLVMPIAMLLTSIITYGTLGEHYELAAMKSTGISLWRMMRALFVISIFMATILFLFSDYVVPAAQRKAKNIAYNISVAEPAVNITAGNFIDMIPNIVMRIDKKTGKNQDLLEGVFIRQYKKSSGEGNTILAEKGRLISGKDARYLEMHLINGVLYSEKKNNDQNIYASENTYQIIEFETLIEHLDISKLANQNLEEENFKDNYSMLNAQKLTERIKTIKADDHKFYEELSKQSYPVKENTSERLAFSRKSSADYENLSPKKKKEVLQKTQEQLYNFSTIIKVQKEAIKERFEYLAKHELELQKKFSFPVSCILMFLIGAPLGAIIRKGGMGMPVLMALIIFIVYFTLLTISQNLSEKGQLSIWLGAWLSNLIMFPTGLWLTRKAMMDAPIMNLDHYGFCIKRLQKKYKLKK
ncbi:LptF/LptG family permease [Bacteroidetes bacterium endosymbiont of Geopemphigus sp.]|uniref:LptF/LptG family permease n=1 Tax=Bacteroidetes bacterium endosymbiont of Geopemphigus sp. TaxID=2047937 RepID=UPI000CD122F8|nr:LptF/LptG family permease [Bacteroidetes bacterium endosymbiont of Geopemphigus sp.]